MTGIYNNKYDILASTISPNPNSVKYWADLATNPSGGVLKYFDGNNWVPVNESVSGTDNAEDIANLQSALQNLQSTLTDEINRATAAEQLLDDNKQDVLVAGEGITISGNTISASIGSIDLSDYAKTSDIPENVSDLVNDAGYVTTTELEAKDYQTSTQVSEAISALVNSAPETLDTLQELAAALGNDPDFATTVTTQLGQKLDTSVYEADKTTFALQADLTTLTSTVDTLSTTVDNKVDKVEGKDLSTNDYTTEEKNKLAELSNYTLPEATSSALGGIKIGYTSTDTKKAIELEDGAAYVDVSDITFDINDIPYPENIFAYGVSWTTGSLNPTLTRVGNLALHRSLPIQSKMKGCTLADDGTVNHYFNSDWTQNEDGTAIVKDGSDGMVMIEIPEFYVKCTDEDGTSSMMISEYPLSGFTKVSKQYISAYEATVDRSTDTLKLVSVVNTTTDFRGGNNNSDLDGTDTTQLGMPATAINLTTFRTYARNRGDHWQMLDFFATNAVWLLFTIEYATWNSQQTVSNELTADGFKQGGLGRGVVELTSSDWTTFNNINPLVPCGASDSLGNNSGEVTYTLPSSFSSDTATVNVCRYRGIENVFGHLFKIVDGILADYNSETDDHTSFVYLADSEANYGNSLTESYINFGSLPVTTSYISDTHLGTFIPSSAADASSSTGRCDYFYTNSENSSPRMVAYGGYASYGSLAGIGCMSAARAAHSSDTGFTTRLVYRGDSTI